MVQFGEFLKTWSLRSNSITRQVSFNWEKIVGNCDILSNFQTMCSCRKILMVTTKLKIFKMWAIWVNIVVLCGSISCIATWEKWVNAKCAAFCQNAILATLAAWVDILNSSIRQYCNNFHAKKEGDKLCKINKEIQIRPEYICLWHGVWKWQKKSHSTLWAKLFKTAKKWSNLASF